MRVVLSGGGTAGHINPALAVAETLEAQGWDVVYAGTPNGVEARLVPAAGVEFKTFEAKGFNRNHPLTLFKALWTIQKSTGKAKAWLQEVKPEVVVGFGGYVSIPVTRAAKSLGVPVVVHEQNSVMGMANKSAAKFAKKVCLTYECASKDVDDKSKVVVTGNPVRGSVLTATREEGRAMLSIPEDAFMLLVFGGSLGARHINTAIANMKGAVLSHENVYVVHITGPKEYEATLEQLALTEEEKKRWIVLDYQNRMGETLAAADAIVSRAGATSLAEISCLGIPAILVPFPFATEDHQTMNARALVDAGCAFMMPDADLDKPEFQAYVEQLIEDEQLRARMKEAALAQDSINASVRLAEAIVSAAK